MKTIQEIQARLAIPGITTYAIATSRAMVGGYEETTAPPAAVPCPGRIYADKLASATLSLASVADHGRLSVTSEGYRCLLVWTPSTRLAIVTPTGHPIVKSLNRTVMRLLAYKPEAGACTSAT